MLPAPDTSELRVEYVPLSTLMGWPGNPKGHDETRIAKSISRFGFNDPFVLDERTNRLVAGHGRSASLKALKDAGQKPPTRIRVDEVTGDWLVPVLRGVSFNSDSEAEAYLLAVNQLTILGGWEDDALLDMLKGIDKELADIAGFTEKELEELAERVGEALDDDEKAKEPVDDTRADEMAQKWGTAVGQMWQIGPHRLMIGDSTDPQLAANLFMGERFHVMFTDPPYGIKYDTTESGRSQRKFKDIANDDLAGDNLEDFCRGFLANACRYGADDWSGYVCFASATLSVLQTAVRSLNIRMSSVPIVWVKDNFALNWNKYHPQHEMIVYCGPGSVQTNGRWFGPNNETTVWDIHRDSAKSYVHPTQKPVELPERGIRNSSVPGEIVFEPFCGSGSTMVAAHLGGRKCRAFELDPGYAAVILERMSALEGIGDIHKIDDIKDFPVPDAPEVWSTRFYRLSRTQSEIVDQAVAKIAQEIGGENADARALEMMAADYLAGH